MKRNASIGLLVSALALGAAAAANSWHTTTVFHAITPAGYDVVLIKPSGSVLTFLGLIECPELEGARQMYEGERAAIVSADGKPLTYFPRHFNFRITASLRKTILVEPTDAFSLTEEPQDLLVQLRFRLRAYHALQVEEIQPQSVQIIGVPADVPNDERVYRVSFSLGDMPITDRCVLEVLSPSGERLTKFHFDLL